MSTASKELCIPAEPVYAWLRDEIKPRCGSLMGIARVLAVRTSISRAAWHRWILRLAHRDVVQVWRVDLLCLIFNEHVSRFDPVYSSMD